MEKLMILISFFLKLNILKLLIALSLLIIKIYLFLLLNLNIYLYSFHSFTNVSSQSSFVSIFPLHNISCSFHPCHVFDGSFSSNFGDDNILCHISLSSPSRPYSDNGTAIGILFILFLNFFHFNFFRTRTDRCRMYLSDILCRLAKIKYADDILSKASHIARDNMCNIFIKSFKGWELKSKYICYSYII